MLLTMAIDLFKRFLPQIIGALVIMGALAYAHHKIDQGGYNRAVTEYEKRDAETQRQSEELLKLKQHEADIANQLNRERTTNAIKIYAQHYDDLRNNPVVERVFIRTKTANCGSDTMPGAGKDRSTTQKGFERVGQTELPESNLRELNKVISDIERMQLKCEQVLNSVE